MTDIAPYVTGQLTRHARLVSKIFPAAQLPSD